MSIYYERESQSQTLFIVGISTTGVVKNNTKRSSLKSYLPEIQIKLANMQKFKKSYRMGNIKILLER